MKQRRYIISAGLLTSLVVLILIIIGYRFMFDPARMPFCYFEAEADFHEGVASHDRGPLQKPALPVRRLEFTLKYPFVVRQDDILLVSAYSESRDSEHRFYDGPPPAGPIIADLPVQTENSAELYILSVYLIRPRDRMGCTWSLEEYFELPAPPHPTRWLIELLAGPVLTDDDGSRLTRITAQR